jgi:hypothetical protein
MQDNAAASSADIKGSFPAVLVKSIDSKKLKEGDVVVCQTTMPLHTKSGLLIPSGSNVIGHVTQASARSKGSPDSTLGITFDKIELSKGKEIAMKGTLQAIAPSLKNGPTTTAGPPSLGGSGSHVMPATGPGVRNEGSIPTGASTTPGVEGTEVRGVNLKGPQTMTAESQGALGMKGVELSKSVITSTGKEVRLDSGTQILIYAEIDTAAQ